MILNFRTQKQLLDHWCWAAVSSSVSFYYNPFSQWRQSTIAGAMIGSACSGIDRTNADSAPDGCDMMMDAAQALAVTKNYLREIPRPLTYEEIVIQINNGFPVCCQIVWDGFSLSHFVTIYGYSERLIIVGDPQAGIASIEYFEFRSDYRTGGKWIRSIGTTR
jgi:hypothetical protein